MPMIVLKSTFTHTHVWSTFSATQTLIVQFLATLQTAQEK